MIQTIKLPKLMEKNSLVIQIEGSQTRSQRMYEFSLQNVHAWPNRCEVVSVRGTRVARFYASDGVILLETSLIPKGPDIFGLVFKRTTASHVDFKSKTQSICAIMKAYDVINAIENIEENYTYDS